MQYCCIFGGIFWVERLTGPNIRRAKFTRKINEDTVVCTFIWFSLFITEISLAIENTLLYRSGTYVFPSTKKASCRRLVIADTEKYTDTLITALDFYVGNFLLHTFPSSLHRTLNVEKALSFLKYRNCFFAFSQQMDTAFSASLQIETFLN